MPAPHWGQQPWGWQPPDPKAQRRKRLLAFGALAGVVVLLVGALVGAGIYEDRRAERVAAEVEALLPDLQAFVADARGLPFLQPVEVEVLTDDDFLDALYTTGDDLPEPREDRDPEPTLKALGLLGEDTDLEEEVTAALDAGVVGFYDPATDQLVVRGRSVTPFVELVLVHELVHALQDQHFDLDRPELDEADDERSIAFSALVEGDATRIETLWFEQQSPRRQRDIAGAFGGEPDGDFDIVQELLGFPYLHGPAYVEALLERGGQEALDAAFADPPTTTEQILRPARDGAVAALSRPEPEGELLDEGVLGLLGLVLLTGSDPASFGGSVDVWNGDHYVTYRSGDAVCTVAHVAVDGGPEATGERDRLSDDLREFWATDLPDAEVDLGPDGTVRLRSCV